MKKSLGANQRLCQDKTEENHHIDHERINAIDVIAKNSSRSIGSSRRCRRRSRSSRRSSSSSGSSGRSRWSCNVRGLILPYRCAENLLPLYADGKARPHVILYTKTDVRRNG